MEEKGVGATDRKAGRKGRQGGGGYIGVEFSTKEFHLKKVKIKKVEKGSCI